MAAGKPKLEVLDALRGFCALVVVALHFSENYIPNYGFRLLPHGCLPVEYFFILTGFTLIYAYDDRWAQGMTIRSFLARRVVRLQPLVVVGSIIGAACYLLSAEQYANRFPCELGLGQLGLLTLWCSTLLPALGLTASKALNGGFEAAAVVVGMPLVLLLGIGGEIRNRKVAAVCSFLGRYSFPLYCTHYSFTILQRVWRDAHPDAPWQMHLATVCACALFAFLSAYVAMLVADWVSGKFKRRVP